MIDLEKAENEFLKYIRKFDLENDNLKRKQLHSLRVMKVSNKIAKNLNLSDEEIQIATLIGLLHDIARFEQFTKYATFRDRDSIDHGDLAVEILKKDDYIKNYVDNETYIDIIYLAIKNHNKFKIENGCNPKQEMFCKIIRDSDKIDILYEGVYIFWNKKEEKENVENRKFSKYMEEEFIKQKQIKRLSNIKNDTIDGLFMLLSYVYDINFKETLQMIKKENYINKILSRFNFKDEIIKEQVNKFRDILNKYVKG